MELTKLFLHFSLYQNLPQGRLILKAVVQKKTLRVSNVSPGNASNLLNIDPHRLGFGIPYAFLLAITSSMSLLGSLLFFVLLIIII